MKKILFSLIIIPFVLIGCGSSAPNTLKQVSKIDYSDWADILYSHVDSEGLVDYEWLLAKPTRLDRFVSHIETVDISNMSDIQQKAFWINSYNALTLKTVVNKYPVKSIRHIDFGLVWEKGKLVANQKYSLGHIEHKILRPLGDPRIHFAINCASIGCPKLPRAGFYPEILDEQLDFETRRFMNDPEKIRLDREENILYHSELLNWFEEDFLEVSKSKLEYIKKYINESDRIYLENNQVKLKKIPYDWGINRQ